MSPSKKSPHCPYFIFKYITSDMRETFLRCFLQSNSSPHNNSKQQASQGVDGSHWPMNIDSLNSKCLFSVLQGYINWISRQNWTVLYLEWVTTLLWKNICIESGILLKLLDYLLKCSGPLPRPRCSTITCPKTRVAASTFSPKHLPVIRGGIFSIFPISGSKGRSKEQKESNWPACSLTSSCSWPPIPLEMQQHWITSLKLSFWRGVETSRSLQSWCIQDAASLWV